MKKLAFFWVLISIFLVTSPCQTSTEPANSPEKSVANLAAENESTTAENAIEKVTENPEELANLGEQEAESENEAENEAEKVSEEDSNLEKVALDAPTTDEKSKVSEYKIYESPLPEVVVHDLPDPETEEAKSETKSSETPENARPAESERKPETASAEKSVKSEKTAAAPKTDPKIEPEKSAPTKSPIIPEVSVTDEKNQAENSESEKEVSPSRSVTMRISQYLDVTYPGNGWTYIGEGENSSGQEAGEQKNSKGNDELFNYFGRKLGGGNTTFALRAKKSGTVLLHFYKNDALTGEYIDDYLEVKVLPSHAVGRIKAPSYADIIPAKPQRRIERSLSKNDSKTEEPGKKTEPSKSTKSIGEDLKNQLSIPSTTLKKNAQKTETLAKTDAKNALPQEQKTDSSKSQKSDSNIKTVIQTTDSSQNSPQSAAQNQVAKTAPTPQATSKPATVQKRVITLKDDSAPEIPQPEDDESTDSYGNAEYSDENETQMQFDPEYEPWKKASASSAKKTTGNSAKTVSESLLEKAKQDFVDGKFSDALGEAQEYYNYADTRLDEALFLLGQISESNGPQRNIRFAVDSYDMLVNRFPASRLWNDAKNRSVYLKRFYIDIR